MGLGGGVLCTNIMAINTVICSYVHSMYVYCRACGMVKAINTHASVVVALL